MPDAPLVVSAFIQLHRDAAKHAYQLQRTVLVPADYVIYCTNRSAARQPSPCETVRESRARARGKWRGGVSTETRASSMEQLVGLLASGVGLPRATIRAAAERSVVPVHCPSAYLVQIWLAKPLLVADAMAAHPERAEFAWVDAGFNVYQMRPYGPPPPPWLTFTPRQGRLAVAREEGCHNDLHGTNRTRCVVGTFLYGSRQAWEAFVPLYARRVRELVQAAHGQTTPSPRAGLCLDQDIFEDVAEAAPHVFDEFDVSGAWGWSDARPHNPNAAKRRRSGRRQ
jgi:hypothetical protein